MKRLPAAVSLLLILFTFGALAAPPVIDSLEYQAPGEVVLSWSGSAGATFAVARSDHPVADWGIIASNLTGTVYTDSVDSVTWAWYRVEEELSDLLRITSIASTTGGIVIAWDGGPTNSTYTVARSDLTLTNWTALVTNLDVMVYTDSTASVDFPFYRIEGMTGPPPPAVYFEDDFEAGGQPGWMQVVYDSSSNTLWELGVPPVAPRRQQRYERLRD